ncbi:MAG TPA: DUF1501 domain-containing protein, partial [Pirellulaceae bacterium]|nr:DUF1501 domain-containing protein [Pirellulaceae bacterium]
LVIYEEGGISQMDTWDPKPDAPVDHRTPYKPIATSVPGVQFSEVMPQIAKVAHKLTVVRSMTSTKVAGHMEGCQEFFKGYRFTNAAAFPDIGSVVADQLGTDCPQLPPYIFCPGANMPNHITTTGFLPPTRRPWKLGTKSLGENVADPNWKVASLQPPKGLGPQRYDERRQLLARLDADNPLASHALAQSLRQSYQHAFDLLTSGEVQRAFDLSTEPDSVRDRYGRDHRGCCYLMGRKLIEAGVRFVTVTAIQPPEHVGRPNYGMPNGVFLNWDHHEGIYFNGPCGGPQAMSNSERYGLPHPVMMPSLDRSLSALIEDLDQRGMLDDTLVCFITEMGRTPRINKWQGRDHWARAMSVAFAGAGTPGGQVVGRTDREAADVIDALYTPYDYAETVYRKLGIETDLR